MESLGSHTFNMIFIESFRARKRKKRERASEPVAASREQSRAELRKDGVKSRSAAPAGRWKAGAFLQGVLKKRGFIKERARGIQRRLNCHRVGLLLLSSESFFPRQVIVLSATQSNETRAIISLVDKLPGRDSVQALLQQPCKGNGSRGPGLSCCLLACL